VRLRYLQHMVSCKDGYTESYVVSYVICRNMSLLLGKVKVKKGIVHSRTVHEGPEVE